jgi:DNA-binding LacI/PurR family transcriptional regulator
VSKTKNKSSFVSKRVTIREVAKKANVSVTTVSHALSGNGRVNEATRTRIIHVVKELNYIANPQARSLKTKQTMMLLALLPGGDPENINLHSPFISDILIGAAEGAISKGYILSVAGHDALSSSSFSLTQFDGVLLVDPAEHDDVMNVLESFDVSVATIGRQLGVEKISTEIDNDYADSMNKILQHLHKQGYKRLALLTTDQPISYSIDSKNACNEWFKQYGDLKAQIKEVKGYPSFEAGLKATRLLIASKTRPDVIVATTESLALGALQAINEAQLSLPADIGLVSMVDSRRLATAKDPITAIDLHARRLGQTAADILIKQLKKEPTPKCVEVSTELLPRKSTLRLGN